MENKEKKIQKFMLLYMSLGMCFGMSGGLIIGMLLFNDNMALGMCFGIPMGMCIGMGIGAAKDRAVSENMLEIIRIEAAPESGDKFIYTIAKNGEEKEYKITERQAKEQQFSVGDRVAETEGGLVSLESK